MVDAISTAGKRSSTCLGSTNPVLRAAGAAAALARAALDAVPAAGAAAGGGDAGLAAGARFVARADGVRPLVFDGAARWDSSGGALTMK
jgi:hypothetical protein